MKTGFSDVERPENIIQMKFPITWLLGVAGVFVSLGVSLIIQITSMAADTREMKDKFQQAQIISDKRDDRMGLISSSNIEVRIQMNDIQKQITRLSEDVSELRKQENYRQNEKRWAPK